MVTLGECVRAAAVLLQTLLWSLLLMANVLLQRLRRGSAALTPSQRERPACLDDPRYGTHRFATVQGITIHYVEAGDRSRPLLLLLHGFPAFWFCWHYQLTDLAQHYWVVAVDLRGYGESSKPAGQQHYTRAAVAADMFELVTSLDRQTCVVVGHDWGGLIAYQLAQDQPTLVRKLIILNAPHPDAMTRLLRSSWNQLRRSWYIFVFQLPWLPEAALALNDLHLFRGMFSENADAARHYPDSLISAFQYTFQSKGALTPPIHYYRENFSVRDVLVPAQVEEEPARLLCPLLVIWGERDSALSPLLATMAARYTDRFTVRFVSNASHWVMMECPELVNQYIREFVDKD